ncbi:MAG: SAM-dependent methyltransferase, partial [Acidobacteria bacterium]|nr:SAM-dependent methyltransferase [Acidobacteriota bacterium]
GLPTGGNVHEVAQAADAGCQVVYVDVAPDIVVASRALLADNDNAAAVCADLRQPEQVLDAAQRTGLLDVSAPAAILLIDILHRIPDTDNPTRFIQAYIQSICPGSYVAIAQTSNGEDLLNGLAVFQRFYHIPVPPLTFRDQAHIATFFEGLELVKPGIVPMPLWHPERDDDHIDMDTECFPGLCALGRKP